MAKKIVKPAKKANKPAPKKAVTKKAAVKPTKKTSNKPAEKKTAQKPAKKIIQSTKKITQKPALKKVMKPAPKKVVKASKSISKTTKKIVAKPTPKKITVKPSLKGKPIDAITNKSLKNISKSAKPSKKKGKIDDDDEDVDVKDDYEKNDEDDAAVDVVLDEAPVLDLETGSIPIDDDDDDEIPEKRGRGRRKKNEGRSSGSETYIRNRPLHLDITKPLIKKPQVAQPKPFLNTKDDRSRYSDKELKEFKDLIVVKLNEAQIDFDLLKQILSNSDNHGTDDTSPSFKLLEDGSDILSKEETAQLAIRQEKYIVNLKNALTRIENKTYGICRVTGKLIPKERLRSVPHATLSIDAKLIQ